MKTKKWSSKIGQKVYKPQLIMVCARYSYQKFGSTGFNSTKSLKICGCKNLWVCAAAALVLTHSLYLCMGQHYSKAVARQITFNSNSCTEKVTSPENAISCFAVRVQIPEPSLLEGKSPASGGIFKHKIQLYIL